ncbi:TIGR04222 domain-containing membrane protein [Streptomyces sp. NPDC051561]|uniref:TIGR04222 domain-containing membrane protein n=1 Tax=Streptomyces sp. NPDC051561 TaxID=3365658 RepID=UPI00379970D2
MNAVLLVLLYCAVGLSSIILLVTLSRSRSRLSGGRPAAVHDVMEAAFLAGGPGRVVDTALTALHTDGRLAVGGPGIVVVRYRTARDPVERAVLQECDAAPNGALHQLRYAVMRHPAVQEVGDGLAARGLLLPPGGARGWRRWGLVQAVVCLTVLPVLVFVTFALQTAAGSPSDFLERIPFALGTIPALLGGAAAGFVVAAQANHRVSVAGRNALLAHRTDPSVAGSPEQQVAVNGIRSLTDPDLRDQLRIALRQRPDLVHTSSSSQAAPVLVPVMWCAGSVPGGGAGTACGASSSCGSGGCSGGGGGGCGSGGGCGGSSGSSCGGSSSGSSCGGGGGSSCGGGGGSS